jgi:hypothetical protein
LLSSRRSDADAQIYAWRDVNGTLVLSDRKLDDGAMNVRRSRSAGIRATTPMAERNGSASSSNR